MFLCKAGSAALPLLYTEKLKGLSASRPHHRLKLLSIPDDSPSWEVMWIPLHCFRRVDSSGFYEGNQLHLLMQTTLRLQSHSFQDAPKLNGDEPFGIYLKINERPTYSSPVASGLKEIQKKDKKHSRP